MSIKSLSCNLHVSSYTATQGYAGTEFSKKISKDPLGLAGEFTFKYDYPLNTTAKFVHTLKKNMNFANILSLAKKDYQRIYREEDESTKVKPGNIPGMLNRNSTDGKWGIWGHGIDDLYFEGVRIDTVRKTVTFDIGS